MVFHNLIWSITKWHLQFRAFWLKRYGFYFDVSYTYHTVIKHGGNFFICLSSSNQMSIDPGRPVDRHLQHTGNNVPAFQPIFQITVKTTAECYGYCAGNKELRLVWTSRACYMLFEQHALSQKCKWISLRQGVWLVLLSNGRMSNKLQRG